MQEKIQLMDYVKLSTLGDWIFAAGGGALIWTSVYRLGFGEDITSMPRAVFIIATQFLLLGLLMILCGLNLFKIGNLFKMLKMLWGKGLFCLFVAGMMDVMIFSFSNLITLVTLGMLGLGGFYIVLGVIFFFTELGAFSALRS